MVLEMLAVLGVAAGISAVTTGIRRVIFKEEDMRKMAEIQAFNRELLAAQRKKDAKAIQKLQSRKEYIQKLNADVSKKNMLIMFSSMIIFFTVYPLLSGFFGATQLGSMPPGLNIPFISTNGGLYFYGWFILSFFAVGSPIAKILGISPLGMGGQGVEEKPQDKGEKKGKE
ncbi:MAG: EMC3/TMCO1 family protein [Nitrososphaerota archaeon]